MPAKNNNLPAICIRKIRNQPFNNKEIKKFAAKYGIIESIRDTHDKLFVNFSKVTNLEQCIDFFRINGFNVEKSRRNNKSEQNNKSEKDNKSKQNDSINSKENAEPNSPETNNLKMKGTPTEMQSNVPDLTNIPDMQKKIVSKNYILFILSFFILVIPRYLLRFSPMANVFYVIVRLHCFAKDAMIFIVPWNASLKIGTVTVIYVSLCRKYFLCLFLFVLGNMFFTGIISCKENKYFVEDKTRIISKT